MESLIDKKPMVSVIVPTRNNATGLSDCLDSILKQRHSNFEIIVVDNNSTDNTKELVQSQIKENSKIKYFFETRIGRGQARDTGNKQAQGDILLFTDDDCIMHDNWIEDMIEMISTGKFNAVQGYEIGTESNYWSEQYQRRVDETWDKGVGFIDTKNFAIKRDVLEMVGGIDRKFNALIDTELYFRLRQKDVAIFYNRKSIIKHNNPSNFRVVFSKNFIRGFWSYKLFTKHKYEIDTAFLENLCLTPKSFWRYFAGAIINPFIKGFKYSFYDLVVGFAWRMGIIRAFLVFSSNTNKDVGIIS